MQRSLLVSCYQTVSLALSCRLFWAVLLLFIPSSPTRFAGSLCCDPPCSSARRSVCLCSHRWPEIHATHPELWEPTHKHMTLMVSLSFLTDRCTPVWILSVKQRCSTLLCGPGEGARTCCVIRFWMEAEQLENVRLHSHRLVWNRIFFGPFCRECSETLV